jgi:hypothetical protein
MKTGTGERKKMLKLRNKKPKLLIGWWSIIDRSHREPSPSLSRRPPSTSTQSGKLWRLQRCSSFFLSFMDGWMDGWLDGWNFIERRWQSQRITQTTTKVRHNHLYKSH